VLGDAVNFAIGYRLGPKPATRSPLLQQEAPLSGVLREVRQQDDHCPLRAHRADLAPFVAGIGKMQYRRFGFYNVLGGVAG
jgi:membrane protein DedA with SNARE-associated domain